MLAMGFAAMFIALMVALVLSADGILRRKIARTMKHQWSGCLITEKVELMVDANGNNVGRQVERVEKIITPSKWWKCVLPWPGKKRWAETVLAKVALLGATPEYQAISAWDWDEAWVIEVDGENAIASSNKVATALAYLEHMGVPDA
jgi:hypothetical protein